VRGSDYGIVRRRKLDVTPIIPARRIADLTVELDERPAAIRGGRTSHLRWADGVGRRVQDPRSLKSSSDRRFKGIDHNRSVTRVAQSELEGRETGTTPRQDEKRVFTMMRRIGQARGRLAADYGGSAGPRAGKVRVSSPSMSTVMERPPTRDLNGRGFASQSIRGGQDAPQRGKANVEAFVKRPGPVAGRGVLADRGWRGL